MNIPRPSGRGSGFIIAKVSFRGIKKKPLIFVLLLMLLGHPMGKRPDRREARENIATSTMVWSRMVDRDCWDGVLNDFEENLISPPSHAIPLGDCINAT